MCYDNVDYYITAGDVLLFNPCVPHNCEPMDNDLLDLRCLNIKPEIMSQFMQELTGSEKCRCLPALFYAVTNCLITPA